jgi:hypothetical protein
MGIYVNKPKTKNMDRLLLLLSSSWLYVVVSQTLPPYLTWTSKNIQIEPWTSACGACVFLNATTATACIEALRYASVESNEYWWYVNGEICLAPRPAPKSEQSLTLVDGQSTAIVDLVSMFNLQSRVVIEYEDPAESSFATVTWVDAHNREDKESTSPSSPYFVTNPQMANWLVLPWRHAAENATWVSVPSRYRRQKAPRVCKTEFETCAEREVITGFRECQIKYYHCLGWDQWPLPDCRTDPYRCTAAYWGQYITTGTSPRDYAPFGDKLWERREPEPVVRRMIWCTGAQGTLPSIQTGGACGPLNCSSSIYNCAKTTPQNEYYCSRPDFERNVCLANGLCRCHAQHTGSQCEIKLDDNFYRLLQQRELPNRWRRPSEQVRDPGALPRDGASMDWQFWNCSRFNPCSGAGECVDSTSPYEPPSCVCYDGFFGNRLSQLEAFGRTLFCQTTNAAGTQAQWNDHPASLGNGTDPNSRLRRYAMTHQCLFWRGVDRPPQYVVRKDQPHPAVPFTCSPGYAGPGCLPCPPCVHGNCTYMRLGSNDEDGRPEYANVCVCDSNHDGPACDRQRCPMNGTDPKTSTGCGAPIAGRCVPTGPAGKYACECAPGYTGPGCGLRRCVVDPRSKTYNQYQNASLVCSGPTRGWCNVTSNQCVCLAGYAGEHCEKLQCPVAQFNRTGVRLGQVCNGLRDSQNRSVCVNHNPYVPPYCECRAAAGAFEPGNLNRWWGAACDRSYNDSCVDPDARGELVGVWCSQPQDGWKQCFPEVPRRLEGDPRSVNLFPPTCHCLEEWASLGPYCQWSKCGQRVDAALIPVPSHLVCSGYNQSHVSSGKCKVLSAPIPGPDPRVPPPNLDESNSGIITTLGRCHCKPAYVGGRPRMFMGDWCQYDATSCMSPADFARAFEKDGTLTPAGEDGVMLCSNQPHVQHGACVPFVDNPKLFHCKCLENFEGTYCETPKITCKPPCWPAAGECVVSEHDKKPDYKDICRCFEPTRWTSPGDNHFQCNMDWCVQTGGVTSILNAYCHCPAGFVYDRSVSISATATKPVDRNQGPLSAYAGCRRLCPIDPDNDVECGAYPAPSFGAPSFCRNSGRVTKLGDLNGTSLAYCDCQLRNFWPIWSYQPQNKSQAVPSQGVDEFGERMLYWRNPETGLCEPACGHGAQLDWAAYQTPIERDKRIVCNCKGVRAQKTDCGNYTETTRYQVHRCNGRGTWDSRTQRCVCDGLYRWETKCLTSGCEPEGRYSPTFGTAICECSYPYRTDLDPTSPKTYGKCVSDCVHGKPRLGARDCDCDPGWTGKRCEESACGPNGAPCATGCCCSSAIVSGVRCETGTCYNDGAFVVGPPARCACSAFFTGAQCEIDRCGYLDENGRPTGHYDAAAGACRCEKGYALAGPKDVPTSLWTCIRSLCGRGTVMPLPDGFTCRCDGPDRLSHGTGPTATPTCEEGQCIHGYLIEGVNGTKAWCQCEQGYEGADCSLSKCTNPHTEYEPATGGCPCLYPFTNTLTECRDDLCGPGAVEGHRVEQVNLPGNPPEWECVCDAARGFVLRHSWTAGLPTVALDSVTAEIANGLLIQAVLTANAPLYACVLDCVQEQTATIRDDTCICKPGFSGPRCEYVNTPCPAPAISDDVPRNDFYIILFSSLGGALLLGVAAILLVYFLLVRAPATAATLQVPASKSEHAPLLQRHYRQGVVNS